MTTTDAGFAGQARARAYLEGRGYRTVGENVRVPGGEIDIIAENGGARVYVEVKSGSDDPDFPPEAHFDAQKRARYRRLVAAHLIASPTKKDIRVDLVAVSLDTGGVTHYEDVLA